MSEQQKDATTAPVVSLKQKLSYTAPQHNQTIYMKDQEVVHQWFLLDASGKTLGRLATEIANILRGKHRPTYTPNADAGDGVIIINAEKVVITGNKAAQKVYHTHTTRPGSQTTTPYRVMQGKKPQHIITHAVKGMVPRNCLGRRQMKRLRVFKGERHDMTAQQPTVVNI